MIAITSNPPYYAVIFTSISNNLQSDYEKTALRMIELAKNNKGFLGIESARDEMGISVSYWKDLESIKIWKNNSEHLIAQENGKNQWYKKYKVRIAKVERDYDFNSI